MMSVKTLAATLALYALGGVHFAVATEDIDLLDDDLAFTFEDSDLLNDEQPLQRGSSGSSDKSSKKKPAPAPTELEFEEPEEEFDLLDAPDIEEPPELLGNFDGLDDEPIEDFEATIKRTRVSSPAGVPGPLTLDVAGKNPLQDNYALSVLAVERDAILVELPVLVARSRIGLEQEFLLQAEFMAGGIKVGQIQTMVTKASLAEFGPSFAFLQFLAPVIETQGKIEVIVKQLSLDGSSSTELFRRVTPYKLR